VVSSRSVRCAAAVAVAVAASVLMACGGPSEEEGRRAEAVAIQVEIWSLGDEVVRSGELGAPEQVLAMMEVVAEGDERVRSVPEWVEARRFWRDDGRLVPMEEMTDAQWDAFLEWTMTEQVDRLIGSERDRLLVRLQRL
jgi:hypothetical protein